MDKKIVKIRLYGESFKIHALDIKSDWGRMEYFHNKAIELGEPLETALLNANFYKNLSEQEINSVQDIIYFTSGGLVNNSKSIIEIKNGRKLLQKFNLNELFYSKTLFPLFNTYKGSIELNLNNNIFLIEKEVGCIGQYEIATNQFEIDKLKFNISNVKYLDKNYQLLLAINYSTNKLETLKTDTLVTHQHIVNFLN